MKSKGNDIYINIRKSNIKSQDLFIIINSFPTIDI